MAFDCPRIFLGFYMSIRSNVSNSLTAANRWDSAALAAEGVHQPLLASTRLVTTVSSSQLI